MSGLPWKPKFWVNEPSSSFALSLIPTSPHSQLLTPFDFSLLSGTPLMPSGIPVYQFQEYYYQGRCSEVYWKGQGTWHQKVSWIFVPVSQLTMIVGESSRLGFLISKKGNKYARHLCLSEWLGGANKTVPLRKLCNTKELHGGQLLASITRTGASWESYLSQPRTPRAQTQYVTHISPWINTTWTCPSASSRKLAIIVTSMKPVRELWYLHSELPMSFWKVEMVLMSWETHR